MSAWPIFQSPLYCGHVWTTQAFILENSKQLYKFIRSAVSLALLELITSLQLNTFVSLWRIRTKLYKLIQVYFYPFFPSYFCPSILFSAVIKLSTQMLWVFALIILHIQNCLYEQL